jgi:urease accessory protein
MEGACPVEAPGAFPASPSLGPALHALRPGFKERGLPLHFLPALAASLRAADLSLAEGQTLLLHLALRDQLGAAVRLGLVGSLQAQGLHRASLPLAERLRLRHAETPHHRSRRSAPMIDMAQAGHPYLYSRLFQS